jgi:hypothetical protein
MLKKLLITILLLPLLAKAQLPAGQDTTLRTPNTVVTPQYRYANYNGLRIPYIYNPTLAKYDALVTMKYANAWFAPFSSTGYLLRDGGNALDMNIGNHSISIAGTSGNFRAVSGSQGAYMTFAGLVAYTGSKDSRFHSDYISLGLTGGDPTNGEFYLVHGATNIITGNPISFAQTVTATRLKTAVQGGGSLDLFGNTITNPGNTGSNIAFNANLSLASDNTIALNSGGYINLNTPIVTVTQAPSLATVGQVLVRDTTTGQAGKIRQLPLSYFAPSTSINGTQNTIVKYGATGITNSRAIDDGTNFGIGGTPLAPLHVFGIESRLQGSSPFYSFYDQTTGLRSGYVQGAAAAMVFATTNSTQPFNFLVGGTLRARINSQGLQLGSIGAINALLQLTPGFSVPAFSTVGRFFNAMAGVLTDSTSAASATITNASVNTFGIPTIRALNTGVIYTNMGNVVIDGSPLASTNITITNPYSLWVKAGNVRLATYGVGIAHFDANGVISSSTIATADIANNAVTYGKIQALGAVSRLMGSPSSGTTPQDITLGAGLSMSGGTLSATGGTVTSVLGAASRITVATGTTTPVIDISSTFENLLAKLASSQTFTNINTFSAATNSKEIRATGTSVSTDAMGVVGVTQQAGANYASIGITRSGQYAMAMGLGTNNRFITGTGTGRGINATIDTIITSTDLHTGAYEHKNYLGTNLYTLSSSGDGVYTGSVTANSGYVAGNTYGVTFNGVFGGTNILKPSNPSSTSTIVTQIQDKSGILALTSDVARGVRLTGSGDGIGTTISIAHGLSGITSASIATIQPINAASAGVLYITTDATNVNIVYMVAPVLGASNLLYNFIVTP